MQAAGTSTYLLLQQLDFYGDICKASIPGGKLGYDCLPPGLLSRILCTAHGLIARSSAVRICVYDAYDCWHALSEWLETGG